MAETARLKLPLLAAAQAQKHVTHNEALVALDTIVQAAVLDKDLSAPPMSPAEGDIYIVAGSATGAWSGWDGRIVRYIDGQWRSYIPGEGWFVYVRDEDSLYTFDGAAWNALEGIGGGDYLPLAGGTLSGNLGVGGATPDATNRLAVASPAVLFNRETDDIQVKLNKEAAGDDAAFLFQTGFSTRALIGLLGSDDFTFKVSPDGSAFHDAFTLDRNTGNAAFAGALILAADPSSALHAATKQYVDGLAANLGKRARVRAATTGNVTISTALNNGDSLDGVTLATGDWVLVKNQSTAAQNGIYEVAASPARVAEFDTYDEHPGSLIAVEEGTANADTLWLCTSNVGGTLGSTVIAFAKMVIAGEMLTADNPDLIAIEALSATGLLARTASNTWAQRTIAGAAAGIGITNGDGVSGNPTLALANDLAALEGLSSTGLAARTGADAWAQRTVTGTTNEIAVANGDGVSGNPTVSLPSTLALRTKTVEVDQLAFAVSQNASADPNTLDDYEEGTFTPTFGLSGSQPTGVTYTTQVGHYRKVGNTVTCFVNLVLSNKGSGGSGDLRLGGLPFSVINVTGIFAQGGIFSNVTLDSGYTWLALAPSANTSAVTVVESGSNVALASLTLPNCSNTSRFSGCFIYLTTN